MLRKGPGETPGPFAFPLRCVLTIQMGLEPLRVSRTRVQSTISAQLG